MAQQYYVQGVTDEYLRSLAAAKPADTYRTYSSAIRRFTAYCALREVLPIDAPTALVESWIADRLKDVSRNTVYTDLAGLKYFYAWAVERGYRKDNPTVPVDLVDVSDEEEAFILLTLDPLGGMAGVDESKIAELMQEVTVDDAALEAMIASLKPAPASEAEATGTRRTRIGAPKIQYEIVFEDEAQQQRWFALLRTLRPRYPNVETIAGRLDAFMAEALEALGLAPAKEGGE